MQLSTLTQLMSTPLFMGLDEKTVEHAVRTYGYAVTVESGERLMSAGDSKKRLGIIVSGAARVYKAAGERRIFMNVLSAGEMMGAASLFQKDAHAVTEVVATKKCEVVFFDENELRALLQADFRLTENYLAYLTGRIHFLTTRIETIGSPTAREKLLSHIRLNAKEGIFTLKAGYNALADALGIGRASLYRAMDALEAEGIIKREGTSISLLEVI